MMKLSDLSTDRALDVMVEITGPLSDIISDEEIPEEIARVNLPEGEKYTKFALYRAGAEKICKMIPIILKKKRDAVYQIVAAVNGMDIDAVKKQNIMTTCSQVRDIVKDEAFSDFAKSWAQTEKSV